MEYHDNPALQLAYEYVQNTGRHIFLTGKAGTGKTTFLRRLKERLPKRMVVVAPTGVAAINAGGVTIHSFFQLPFGPQLPENHGGWGGGDSGARASAARIQRFSREKINIIRSIDLLVIDEVSMVRADLLDGIDQVLRRYRDRHTPFGGLQLLMIGDLQQLAPVVKDDEWALLRNYYDTMFFFGSRALQQTTFVGIELSHIYRQRDPGFIDLLNKVRNNTLDTLTIEQLNQRYIPGFSPGEQEGYITLTTHNQQAQQINRTHLEALSTPMQTFTAKLEGEFPEMAYPTDFQLQLRTGAQVMFVKNDPSSEKRFYNGKIGLLERISDDVLYVKCEGDEDPIVVSPLQWHNTRYSLDELTQELREDVIGSFEQYPLKLAWAITIHKSQGLTFEKAIIDAQAAFAHGQVYVALSRCTTLQGLVLSSRIGSTAVKNDRAVSHFVDAVQHNQPDGQRLAQDRLYYQESLLQELFDFSRLQKGTDYLLRLIQEHASSIDDGLLTTFARLRQLLYQEFMEVSRKFLNQLSRLIAEQQQIEGNAHLQERICKACQYFVPRFESQVYDYLEPLHMDSDNKQVRKSLHESLERLRQDAYVKLACLKACLEGFQTRVYLEARARASVERPAQPSKAKGKAAETSTTSQHPALLESLRHWRDELAAEENLPGHMILPRRTMIAISNTLPGNEAALSAVHGMGKRKLSAFGHQIIQLVVAYCRQKDIPLQTAMPLATKPEKPVKIPSHQISFELFRQGKSIAEIAQERECVVSTIEGHLVRYVKSGELPVEQIVAPDKLKMISEYFAHTDDFRLGPAREVLGNGISYGELRMVAAYLGADGVVG